MRAGLSTIQQTLTPEAATVLNQSIAEAARRNHGQTTPLHVAATLLASPAGFLRQACIRSHPNSSHPLQCRALELCFSVALERLPTAAAPAAEPPISNALTAALKRAQAHQRRGCPEHQQQPLLAVKIELEQLIISILDDPSVSRVMREASFSSPAVKATIEQSLGNSSNLTPPPNVSPVGLGFRPVPTSTPATRSLYLNPRLQRSDEVKRVMDILGRARRRNPVLVGDSEPGRLVGEILKKIEDGGEFGNPPVKNAEVIRLQELNPDKAVRIKELGGLLEAGIRNSDPGGGGGGVILDLGDLKWLVEQQHISLGATQPAPLAAEVGRTAVAELRKLLEKFEGRLWFIGTATCETYLRCQVYHPSMENDWDLQAVPVAAKAPPSGVFPRLGNSGMLGTSVESFTPLKTFPAANRQVYEKVESARRTIKCCPQCLQNYEQEVSKLDISSPEVKPEAAESKLLPQWLMNAKVNDADVKPVDQSLAKIQELQKKWNDTCLRLHPSYHHKAERIVPMPISLTTSAYSPNLLLRQPMQPKLPPNGNLCERIHLNSSPLTSQPAEQEKSPPGSPVRTELVLGRPKVGESSPERTEEVRVKVKGFLGCISSEAQNDKISDLQGGKLGNSLDIDLFKKLLKGLSEKVWWQHDAASAVAATVSQCKLGNGKRRGVSSKGDVWLLFLGPDRVGKKKMASVLSNLVYGASPTTIYLGSRRDDGDAKFSFRGKTALDRIAETVKRSPFSVIVLEDIDEVDMLLRGSIKRAMETGRLCDSHGREISLGNVVFVLTASWASTNNKTSVPDDETKLCGLASENWGLKLRLRERGGKRRPSWLYGNEERPTKPKKETGSGLSFDLNQAADTDDDKADGSYNTSDLTSDQDQEEQGLSSKLSLQYVPFVFHELISRVDDAVVFKPVDFGSIRRNIVNSLSERFGKIMGDSLSLEIEDEALERILGEVWLGQKGVEEWMEGTIVPGLGRLKSRLSATTTYDERTIAQLELDENSGERNAGDLLPRSVRVVVD